MTFFADADAYDRFMGRYSVPLAGVFADFAAVPSDARVLDVGCGPGALVGELVRRHGAARVVAVDPTSTFVEAARRRHPDVDVHVAGAEELPFGDGEFDAALAQLVVHFMADPVAGVREMARVTRARGAVAACVWDLGGDHGPLTPFWRAARELDPSVDDESERPGTHAGQLTSIFENAGLRDVDETLIGAAVRHETFEEWWEPFTLGIGPAGAYTASLDEQRRQALRERCRDHLPNTPVVIEASAWAARGVVA